MHCFYAETIKVSWVNMKPLFLECYATHLGLWGRVRMFEVSQSSSKKEGMEYNNFLKVQYKPMLVTVFFSCIRYLNCSLPNLHPVLD